MNESPLSSSQQAMFDAEREKFLATFTNEVTRTCDDTGCSCRVVGKKYSDLTLGEQVVFDRDDDLDLCSHCGIVISMDDMATDDYTGDSIGVCNDCMVEK